MRHGEREATDSTTWVGGSPAGGPAAVYRRRRVALLAASAVVVAEAVVALVDPLAGAVLHALLLVGLLWRWLHAGELLVLALVLLPLGRLTSTALTPSGYSASSYAMTGLPLLVAVLWIFPSLPARRVHAGHHRRPAAVAVAISGIPLGLLMYAALDLPRLPGSGTATVVIAALAVFLFSGVLEEMMFRGVLLRCLEPAFGGWSVGLTAVLHAAAYLPTRDLRVVAAVAALGAVAGWYVRRSGSLWPVVVAHGSAAAGALVVWPALL